MVVYTFMKWNINLLLFTEDWQQLLLNIVFPNKIRNFNDLTN